MSYSTTIGGVNWYHYLVVKTGHRSLFSTYPRETLGEKFIVCWDYLDRETGKVVKLYAVLPNYVHFVKFFLTVPKPLRSFYEIILGENSQKPHFDVDVDVNEGENEGGNGNVGENGGGGGDGGGNVGENGGGHAQPGEQILSNLIGAVVQVLAEREITIDLAQDVCIYSSHGPGKISYHVIINGWCHANHNDAKAFYGAVMELLPAEYAEKKWIDSSVYSKTQQFRTYGSCKTGTERRKQLVLEWRFGDRIIQHPRDVDPDPQLQFLEDFERSVISATARRCKLLPSWQSVEEPRRNTANIDGTISKDLAWEAIQLLAHKAGVTPDHPKFPYRFSEIEGTLILLKRERPSRCRVCNRIHEHENPYLLYYPETGDVYFDCRRSAAGKKMYVGCLKVEDDIPSTESPNGSEESNGGESNASSNGETSNGSESNASNSNASKKPEPSPEKRWRLEKIQQLAQQQISRKPKKKAPSEQAYQSVIDTIRSQI